ncbi:MAG: hypothetical protein KKH51_08380 [Actinobacteria bacterium]|nr:hypothetical protein [Actinomycetota bacterium]
MDSDFFGPLESLTLRQLVTRIDRSPFAARYNPRKPPSATNFEPIAIRVAAPRLVDLVERLALAGTSKEEIDSIWDWAKRKAESHPPLPAEERSIWDGVCREFASMWAAALSETGSVVVDSFFTHTLTVSGPEPGLVVQWYADSDGDLSRVTNEYNDSVRRRDARLKQGVRADPAQHFDEFWARGVVTNAAGRPVDPAPYDTWLRSSGVFDVG